MLTFELLNPQEIYQTYNTECLRIGIAPDLIDYAEYLDALEASMRPDPDFNL